MADPSVVVSFKDMKRSEKVRERVEERCARMAADFPETTKFEVTLEPDGPGFLAHGHVTGRDTEVATRATGERMGQAADRLLDKLSKALRRSHDKRIFKDRRAAQKNDPKRRSP
jgi:ribosome-associated translation inhibitor RaiA